MAYGSPPGETREKVRALLIQGLTRNQIAAALGISNQAVQKHVTRLRELGEIPAAQEATR